VAEEGRKRVSKGAEDNRGERKEEREGKKEEWRQEGRRREGAREGGRQGREGGKEGGRDGGRGGKRTGGAELFLGSNSDDDGFVIELLHRVIYHQISIECLANDKVHTHSITIKAQVHQKVDRERRGGGGERMCWREEGENMARAAQISQ